MSRTVKQLLSELETIVESGLGSLLTLAFDTQNKAEVLILIIRLHEAGLIAPSAGQYDGPSENCDLCGADLNEIGWFIDGRIKGSPAWACMCPDCFIENGKGLRWGSGQLYRKMMDDEGEVVWALIAGSEPGSIPQS